MPYGHLSRLFEIALAAILNPTALFNSLLRGIIVLLFFGCAGQLPPPGGPPDTTPPEVVRTLPANNATNVDTRYLELEFSERVDRRSVQESLFISPPVKISQYDWNGRTVKVQFDEPLREKTTFVVNVGTDVVDTRAGNRMASAYTVAFSTGDEIDPGLIEGRVYDKNPEGLLILGYRLARTPSDSLDPSTIRPDYVTQTGKDGLFAFKFVALETYRLFAVKDEYRNILYDTEVDAFGVLQDDIALSAVEPAVSGLRFRMAKEDTTAPILVSAKSPDRNHLKVRFNERVRVPLPWNQTISILDTLRKTPLEILTAFFDFQETEVFNIVTSTQDSSATYRVTIMSAEDYQGNSIRRTARSSDFQASDRRDSLAPSILL